LCEGITFQQVKQEEIHKHKPIVLFPTDFSWESSASLKVEPLESCGRSAMPEILLSLTVTMFFASSRI